MLEKCDCTTDTARIQPPLRRLILAGFRNAAIARNPMVPSPAAALPWQSMTTAQFLSWPMRPRGVLKSP